MRVSKARGIEGALIATGFPYRANTRYLDSYLAMLRAVSSNRPPACAAPAPPRSTWPTSPPGASMAFWEIGLSPGTRPPARCSSRRRAGASARSPAVSTSRAATSSRARRKVYAALVELLAPHVPPDLREP